ncbi:GGDEF domain-containing protein [Lucifera butyrica]|uniref:GGDEF domain-containing protein n=1 Tax=Lucifera butyrica TaxID=1351585 RepID=UPI001403F167|nr:GGDEF domain-containing protein [Lucifera butyrica]
MFLVSLLTFFSLAKPSMVPAASLNLFSYGVFFLGLLLSACFHRSRAFFIILILGLSQLALTVHPAPDGAFRFYRLVIYPLICFFLPLNIIFFSRVKERGLLSFWGFARLGLILLQGFYIALAIFSHDAELTTPVRYAILPPPLPFFTPLPQTALFLFLAVFLFLLRQGTSRSYIDRALLAVLLAAGAAFHYIAVPNAVPFFLSTAIILLIIAVMQDSYAMAYIDELTGLPGRRALNQELLTLRGQYAIAMLDIDHFKKFNDTYGHDTGDDVLRLVATVMKEIEGGGKPFRYGGEEFSIIFPGQTAKEALPHLEALRQKIAKTPYVSHSKGQKKKRLPKRLFVTVSMGLAENSDSRKTGDMVIKNADKALYRAKENGRNCIKQ